jgi:UDP-glucuronate 4-epimerase
MPADIEPGTLLVTGASGQIGQAVCRLLKATRRSFLPVDVQATAETTACDLRSKGAVAALFSENSIGGVIHLAAILPTAFHSNPLAAVDVNLTSSFELLRRSVQHRIRRFVFASSMSVYGTAFDSRPRTEDDPATPADPYGASKRVVEVIGENLARSKAVEFVSLRIARVVGDGARQTSSPWRSQIFERPSPKHPIRVSFAPETFLSLVHVEDVARALVTLMDSGTLTYTAYNTPAEKWQVSELKTLIEETRGLPVVLDPDGADGGPLCDGSRFSREFDFRAKRLRERLSEV